MSAHDASTFMNTDGKSTPLIEFGKRDIILIVGLLLFMIGLIPFMAPAYAAAIVIAMYFGIKIFVARQNKIVQKEVGPEGICMECGCRISDGRCPECDDAAGDATHNK